MTLGYPHAPRHINHRDTFTTLLIRQGPQCTPPNIPSYTSPTPSLSLGQSQGSGEGGGGGQARAEDGGWVGGVGSVCVCVCVKLDPFIQKPSPGTTAGTRLLLGLSTVAPQEQQKAPPNAPCSSSVNTHTHGQHAAAHTHTHTLYTSSGLTVFNKHTENSFFLMLYALYYTGNVRRTAGWGECACSELQ